MRRVVQTRGHAQYGFLVRSQNSHAITLRRTRVQRGIIRIDVTAPRSVRQAETQSVSQPSTPGAAPQPTILHITRCSNLLTLTFDTFRDANVTKEHYRAKAEECLRVASETTDRERTGVLHMLAAGYFELAERAGQPKEPGREDKEGAG